MVSTSARSPHLVYQADVRMGSEHFERIRRNLQILSSTAPIAGFDPKLPWDLVMSESVRDREFWDLQVRNKALL
jgi:hypothetical protein